MQALIPPQTQTEKDLYLVQIENFQTRLNTPPKANEVFKTPDGKADDLPISYVEMTLDELFFGQWSIKNFQSKVIANEVIGELELEVLHPVTKMTITRTGAAAIQIMVDKAPDNLQGKAKNAWALDINNKKPNALDMAYPKLKAECLKNAAKTLGKVFGRDLNRREKVDTYQPVLSGSEKSKIATVTRAIANGDTEGARALMKMMSLSDEAKEMLNAQLAEKAN